MLRSLQIQNFALIDAIELNFDRGYSVITGETGSGKSILLGALNLILGERADFSVIGPSSDKAIVEAEFDLHGFELEPFFTVNELDYASVTLIRREINLQGRSRAFINDTPVQLNVLKELTSKLVNIHSQYNTLELKNKSYQLDVVDVLAELRGKRHDFELKFKQFKELQHELNGLNQTLALLLQQQDYTKFQLEELDTLRLEEVDYDSIENELNVASNADMLQQILGNIVDGVDGDNQILDKLRLLKSSLEKINGIDSEIDDLTSRIVSVMIELADISSEAAQKLDSIEFNPAKVDQLVSTLDKFNHVLRKHNLSSKEDLILLRTKLENAVLDTEETQNRINLLEIKVEKEQSELEILAQELHDKRCSSVGLIANELSSILAELKLPNTKLEIVLTKRNELNQFGMTDVQFLFSANLGLEPVPIEKAASGGELSRVMLALQQMISAKTLLPTVLFDEIDTGVSGDVAQKIGRLLEKMGDHFQLIAISHLPQVAARAKHHFKVEKEIVGDRTISSVRKLNLDHQIEEIARLMSGEQITDAALENAKSLML